MFPSRKKSKQLNQIVKLIDS